MNDYYRVIILLFAAGFTAITGQAVFFREMLSAASPMESGLAAMIFFWSAGAVLSVSLFYERAILKLTAKKLMVLTALLTAANAFVTLLAPVLLRFIAGAFEVRGPAEAFLCAAPALLTGAMTAVLFAVLSLALTIQRKEVIARSAIAVFAAGCVSAGIIFSLFAAGRLPPLMLLYWTGIINMALAYILFREKGPEGKVITLSIVTMAIIYLMPLMGGIPERFDAYTFSLSKKGEQVLHVSESANEKTAITKKEGVYSLYVNGSKRYEYPGSGLARLVSSAAPQGDVLLIEGGYAGGVNERKKYPAAASVSALEPFAESAYASALFFGADIANTVNVRFIYGDPEAFFRSAPDRKFDTIIINTAGESSVASLRLRSAGLFKNAEGALKSGGSITSLHSNGGSGPVPAAFSDSLRQAFFGGAKGSVFALGAAAIAVLCALLAFGFSKQGGSALPPVFSAAASFISISLLITLAWFFQWLYGGLYRYIGIILAIYWAGLLAGAFFSGRAAEWERPLMAGAVILNAAVLFTIYFSPGAAVAVMLFTAAAGFIQGAMFNSRLRFFGAAALQTFESAGAAAAALCAAIFVLPALGAAGLLIINAVIAAAVFLSPSGGDK